MPDAVSGDITVVALTGASQEIAPPNRNRVSILFSKSVNAGNVGINIRPLANADDGLQANLLTGNTPFRYYDFGEIVRGPWFGFATAAGGNIVVFEGIQA